MANDRVVHVIDDDDAVRDSLAFLLKASGYDARTYESALSFLERLPNAERGCVVTDVRMPGMTGLELATRLKELGSDLPIIVITGHGDVPLAVQAMKAGVADFIEKPFEEDEILRAVESALAKPAETPSHSGQNGEVLERLASLSTRERQVLDGLVEGKANKVVAQELGISPRTVEVYRANVMTKMQANSLSELVRMTILAEVAR